MHDNAVFPGRTVFSFLRKFFSSSVQLKECPPSYIVIGIGNPGNTYRDTRHNVGYMVVDGLTKQMHALQHRKDRLKDFTLSSTDNGLVLGMAKPLTFVNRSGIVCKELLDRFKLDPVRCLVIADDFHLKLGTIRLRREGSAGGHKGLESVIEQIGSTFPRLRIGIGPVPDSINAIDFVLGKFSPDEIDTVRETVDRACKAIVLLCHEGIEKAMNVYNTR